MGTEPTVMTQSLSVTPERVVKWILAVPGVTVHAVPYGSIERTSGFELVQVPYSCSTLALAIGWVMPSEN